MIGLVFALVTGLMLGAAVLLAIVRIIRGPSAVDRAVANEVVVSTMVCALGVEAALNRHDTTLPILASLSLVGFLASVAVARFAAREKGSLQLGGRHHDDILHDDTHGDGEDAERPTEDGEAGR